MSWRLVRPEGDPTPGDPEAVRTVARTAGEAAGEFDRAQDFVAGIANGSEISGVWSGVAATAFMTRAKDFNPELKRAESSFTMLSTALFTWASALDDLQRRAGLCLKAAEQARSMLDDAESKLWYAEREYDTADPPFDTSRRDFLEDYERAVDYWRGSLDDQRKSADDLAKEHQDKAGRQAQAVVDASKAGFRGDNFGEKFAKYSGYVGEELLELGDALLDYVVRIGELYIELKKLELELYGKLLSGDLTLDDIGEFADDYTKTLDTLLDELAPVVAILSLLPFPPAQAAARAIQGLHLAVKLTRRVVYDDGSWAEIGLDAALILTPKVINAQAGKHGKFIDKAIDYRRGKGAFYGTGKATLTSSKARVATEIASKFRLERYGEVVELLDKGSTGIGMYERYREPAIRESALGESRRDHATRELRIEKVAPIDIGSGSGSGNSFQEGQYVGY